MNLKETIHCAALLDTSHNTPDSNREVSLADLVWEII